MSCQILDNDNLNKLIFIFVFFGERFIASFMQISSIDRFCFDYLILINS